MRYRVVFEYQSEGSAMSDVYNYREEQLALDKFAELRNELMLAIDSNGCEVIDEPVHYSVINRDAGIYGYVRLLTD